MKKLVLLFVLMFGVSIVYAQHNPVVNSGNVTLTTTAITPFTIYDATPSSTPHLPDVIKGQKRTLSHFPLMIFEMLKESGYNVRLTLQCPEPVNGVNLNAHWYFNDTPPPWSGDFPGTQVNNASSWDWGGAQNQGWVSIHVMEIDATAATTTGLRTFTATGTGYYTGL